MTWDTFVSDFKQRFLPPQFLTALEDEFAALTQKGLPIVTYSNKLLTLSQQIGTPDKEKLCAFVRGLDSSIKYAIRNLNPKSLMRKLWHWHRTRSLSSTAESQSRRQAVLPILQGGGKNQADKTQAGNGKNGKANGKPKQTPDEKAKAGTLGGFLSEEERKHTWVSRDVSIATPKGIGNRSVRSGRQNKLPQQQPPLLHPQSHSNSRRLHHPLLHPVQCFTRSPLCILQ